MAEKIKLLLYSERIKTAVDQVLGGASTSVYGGRKHSGRSTLTDRGGAGGGGMSLGIVKQAPNGDGGAAVIELITVNSDGSYSKTGTEVAVICPNIEKIVPGDSQNVQ